MSTDTKYCFWTNTCKPQQHLCCHSCKVKNCDVRCTDDYDDCKYKISSLNELFESKPSFELKEEKIVERGELTITELSKLRNIKESQNWTIADMAKIIEVPHNLIQRLLSEKTCNSHIKIVKERYDKIVSFLNNYKELT